MPATFVRRERKHRRLAKLKDAANTSANVVRDDGDPNREIVHPTEVAERDARREQLRASLRTEGSKINSKKRKRLDHYIETKLKKEDNAELIRRLASQHVNTSLLQSSKTFGRVKESKRDILKRSLQEQKAGIDSYGDRHAVLYTSKPPQRSSSPGDGESDQEALSDCSIADNANIENGSSSAPATVDIAFGSGLLNQPAPITRRKRRRTQTTTNPVAVIVNHVGLSSTEHSEDEEETNWLGFTSDEDSQDVALSDADSALEESLGGESHDTDSSSRMQGGQTVTSSRKDLIRASAFKQWAETQRNIALEFTPSTAATNDQGLKAAIRPRLPSPDSVSIVPMTTQSEQRTLKAVLLERDSTIQSVRIALPVVQEEQRIMEAINQHPIVIIWGATGSGKTTQVPQMMLESGYGNHCGDKSTPEEVATWTMESQGMIGVTQPRRVAALAVAERVKTELGQDYGDRVAHHVRYNTNISRRTALKFMTDGILLRELHQDFILSRYSAIIIDEAHERSVNTDILIGTLSRIVTLRQELTKEDPSRHFPLKLVIMSATLRVADFIRNERLFRDLSPPIVEAEGRQYGVTIHFARRTHQDYESEMTRKIAKAHRKLPNGTILAFLTGQAEIKSVMKQLQTSIGEVTSRASGTRVRVSADQLPLEPDDMDAFKDSVELEDDFDIIQLEQEDEDDEDLEVEPLNNGDGSASRPGALRSNIVPLYAALPAEEQLRVFQPPPEGTRMIILATNVAETSLTIPGVRYVFDCGRSKEKKYDVTTGVSTFEVDWISKASAEQRTGRAGRTGPGHCWRLYSSALYEEHFPDHSTPEILRTPVESIVLSLKAMSIDNVANFPFPTPPDRFQLQAAARLLGNLGALDSKGKLTQQGYELMHYPLNPRYGKILLLAVHNRITEHAVALVAALAVGEMFLPDALAHTAQEDKTIDDSQTTYGRAQSLLSRWDDQADAIKMLTAVAVHGEAVAKDARNGGRRICTELYLREKGMTEVQQLRAQLRSILNAQSKHRVAQSGTSMLGLASTEQRKMLKQIVAAAYIDQVAIRADLLPQAAAKAVRQPRRAIEVPYYTLFPTDKSQPATPVFVHASSVMARLAKDEMPHYIIYSHLSRAAPKTVSDDSARTRIHPLTSVGGKILAMLAQDTPILRLGKPVGKIEELDAGKRRVCWINVALQATSDVDGGPLGMEWPMAAWKVEQTRQRNGEWLVTKVVSR